jgi:ATP-dependent Clp protease protease subunit
MKKIDDFNCEDRIDIKLLENNIYFLNGELNDDSISKTIKWFIFQNLDPKIKTLTLYINSTGGDLYQTFGLIDVMRTSPHTVQCIGLGAVMSAAFLIFASGDKGHRYAAKNTSFMCHQFSESMDHKYHDLKATMKENDICNERMIAILKEATGMTNSNIKRKLLPASDVYLTAEEMLELGVADYIL